MINLYLAEANGQNTEILVGHEDFNCAIGISFRLKANGEIHKDGILLSREQAGKLILKVAKELERTN